MNDDYYPPVTDLPDGWEYDNDGALCDSTHGACITVEENSESTKLRIVATQDVVANNYRTQIKSHVHNVRLTDEPSETIATAHAAILEIVGQIHSGSGQLLPITAIDHGDMTDFFFTYGYELAGFDETETESILATVQSSVESQYDEADDIMVEPFDGDDEIDHLAIDVATRLANNVETVSPTQSTA